MTAQCPHRRDLRQVRTSTFRSTVDWLIQGIIVIPNMADVPANNCPDVIFLRSAKEFFLTSQIPSRYHINWCSSVSFQWSFTLSLVSSDASGPLFRTTPVASLHASDNWPFFSCHTHCPTNQDNVGKIYSRGARGGSSAMQLYAIKNEINNDLEEIHCLHAYLCCFTL